MSKPIAEKYIPKKTSFLNPFGSDELKPFLAEPGTVTWNRNPSPPVVITHISQLPKNRNEADLVRLHTEPFDLELRFSRLLTQDNDEIDIRIKTLCKIEPPREFLFQWENRLNAANRLLSSDLEERIINQVKPRVVDLIKEHNWQELFRDDFLTTNTYSTSFRSGFEELGLELCKVEQVEYFCEKATEREKLEKFRSECERMQERERITFAHEEATKTRQLETAERIREIEHQQQLAEERRQIELEQIRGNALYNQMLEQLKHELACKQIEEDIAVLRDKQNERERIEQERRSLEELFAQFQGDYQHYQQAMVEALQGIKEAQEKGTAITLALYHELLKTSTATLTKIGVGMSPEMVRVHFQELKGRYDKVPMKVKEASSRDIGSRKFDELRIDQSLAFEFVSPKDGYITIINLGTSGNFWLHVPNAYVKQAMVKANQTCSVPGDLLLPQTELRRHRLDYMECGPVGWEELIVIVTPTPLFHTADVFEASSKAPFVQILLSRMEKLITELDTMPPNNVAFGTLGFVVRDR